MLDCNISDNEIHIDGYNICRLDITHKGHGGILYYIKDGIVFNPKRAGGGIRPPPFDIFCYISAGCYFFALKLLDFFPSSLALDLRPFL